MARTKRSAHLDTRNKRLSLASGKLFTEPLQRGGYLIYRKPLSGACGTWFARWVDPDTKKQQQTRLGDADDLQDADGLEVLTFAQAQVKAGAWFRARTHQAAQEAGGEVLPEGPYTVRNAIRDYLDDAQRRGIKGHLITTQSANAHILPTLGDVQVARLTRRKIEDWHQSLAASPRRTHGKPPKPEDEEDGAPTEPTPPPAPLTEEAKRRRKATANRVLTILRAALNHALAQRKISEPASWREVKPFKGVEVARIRFLSIEEQRRLVNACTGEFRTLVEAALFTGARYGELTRLRVQDFNSKTGNVFIEVSKSGHTRHIWLTEEAKAWFIEKTAGRDGGELLLTRTKARRTKRRASLEAQTWAPYDQVYRMAEACTKAGLSSLTFHELRHTYASLLVNRGVPLAYVAAQLGHRDTTMVQKYYGHLCPDALAESIRANVPALGIAEPAKIVPLKVRSS